MKPTKIDLWRQKREFRSLVLEFSAILIHLYFTTFLLRVHFYNSVWLGTTVLIQVHFWYLIILKSLNITGSFKALKTLFTEFISTQIYIVSSYPIENN